jgi:hypothetical protein
MPEIDNIASFCIVSRSLFTEHPNPEILTTSLNKKNYKYILMFRNNVLFPFSRVVEALVNIYLTTRYHIPQSKKKGKAVPITRRETSRLPHFLDSRLRDGGEVISFETSWYSFLLEAESILGP